MEYSDKYLEKCVQTLFANKIIGYVMMVHACYTLF